MPLSIQTKGMAGATSTAPPRDRRITVLISGTGTNLQALIDACKDSRIPNTRIVRVTSNRKAVKGLERAEAANIPTTTHNLVPYRKSHPSKDPAKKDSPEGRAAYDAELARLVLEDDVDLVVCAGFMHSEFSGAFPLCESLFFDAFALWMHKMRGE